jgi:hypothetical protein
MAKRKPSTFNPAMSPREFLRSRRPERFSDSVVVNQPGLDRSLLEYHLETITNRSQEVAFATFARRLAEFEICPNLLPQTGPTGGGDSKVDSETYPVAEEIALGWFTGIGSEAASERWGFAFSAKKKWRDKVTSDLRKMVGTGRGYTRAFFLSNQYIPDKDRAEVEDKLRKELGLDIRILDRTWILNKVFENGRESLAVEELKLSASIRKEIRRARSTFSERSSVKSSRNESKVHYEMGAGGSNLLKTVSKSRIWRGNSNDRVLKLTVCMNEPNELLLNAALSINGSYAHTKGHGRRSGGMRTQVSLNFIRLLRSGQRGVATLITSSYFIIFGSYFIPRSFRADTRRVDLYSQDAPTPFYRSSKGLPRLKISQALNSKLKVSNR